MNYLYIKRRCNNANARDGGDYSNIAKDKKLLSITVHPFNIYDGNNIIYYFLDPDRLPLPEREFLTDREELFMHIEERIKFRPVDILTREDCNTIAGRTKLLEWEQSRPYIEENYSNNTSAELKGFNIWSKTTEWGGFQLQTAPDFRRKNNFDETKIFTPQQTIEYILRSVTKTPNKTYNGLWGMYIPTNRELISHASESTVYHPDMLFANIEGHDITTRDQFRDVVEKYATDIHIERKLLASLEGTDNVQAIQDYTAQQAVDELLNVYDNCQHLIDCLWATYELFRTEQYVSIEGQPMTVQRVAIRNFLSLFNSFNNRSGVFKNLYSIRYKGAVAANTKKRLNIPDEVFNYSKKTFRIEPLSDPTPIQRPTETSVTTTDTLKGAIVSKEIRKQRDVVQLQIPFGTFLDKRPEQLGGKSIGEVLPEIVLTDIEKHKLFVNLIAAAQRDPSIDIQDIAQRVAKCTNYNELDKLTAIPVTINARDIIKSVFGKVSPANTEKFEFAIRNLPNEPFIHYPLYTHKNKRTGVVTTQRVTSANIDEFKKKGYSPIGYLMPRFGWGGWKAENRKVECIINVNALHYSAMADENGHLSNYDYYTPEYIEYVNSTDNDTIQYAYPTERLIFKAYDQHFKRGATIVGKERKAAKERGEKLNAEEIEQLRKTAQTITINKQQFYTQVLECTYKTPDVMTNKQKSRIMTYIDDALRRMVEHGVLIKKYNSTDDGKSWRVTFIDPQRPSF